MSNPRTRKHGRILHKEKGSIYKEVTSNVDKKTLDNPHDMPFTSYWIYQDLCYIECTLVNYIYKKGAP